MFKATARCQDLLLSLCALENPEEYGDTLMASICVTIDTWKKLIICLLFQDLVLNLKVLVDHVMKDQRRSEESLLCCHQITTCLKYIADGADSKVHIHLHISSPCLLLSLSTPHTSYFRRSCTTFAPESSTAWPSCRSSAIQTSRPLLPQQYPTVC